MFNDDAQVLSEAPEQGTSAFVRDWLDRESEAVPFTAFVFLAATPDICTFDSEAGEMYGARFGPAYGKHFPRDKGREKAPIMTDYVGKVRRMLDAAAKKRKLRDARSRPERLMLGVRVPESLPACWLAGVDIETWVKNGWIDYVVISTWNNTDPQLPVEEFAQFTKPAGRPPAVLGLPPVRRRQSARPDA